jgi:predicted flap endonuclease-1-like 5' DNA nuclease
VTNYNVAEIEGIGEVYAAKLHQAGIKTVNDVLEKGKTPEGRKALAAETDIDGKLILKWVNMADLFRVKGIGQEYSELLEKAGVDTVKELRNRNPENLLAKIKEVNASGPQLVRALPGLKQLQDWVDAAKTLEPMVTY